MKKGGKSFVGFLSVVCACLAGAALAESKTWTGGNLNDPTHWNPNGVPGAEDSVTMTASGNPSNDITDWTIKSMYLSAGSSTKAFNGNALTIKPNASGMNALQVDSTWAFNPKLTFDPSLYSSCNIRVFNNATMTFNGEVDATGMTLMGYKHDAVNVSGGTFRFNGALKTPCLFLQHTQVKAEVNGAGNDIKQVRIYNGQNSLVLGRDYALDRPAGADAAYTELSLGHNAGATDQTVDLNGHSQRAILTTTSNKDGSYPVLTSASAAELHDYSAANYGTFCIGITGTAGYVLEANASKTFTKVQVSSGMIGANAGTVILNESGVWTKAFIGGTGSLTFKKSDAVSSGHAIVELDGSGKLTLADGTLQVVKELWIGGEKQASGYWGGTEAAGVDHTDAHLAGGGRIFVAPGANPKSQATWDNGGADNALKTAGNWSDNKSPNLSDATFLATFASAGDKAVITEDAALDGIVADFTSVSAFALESSGAAKLTLGGDGIAVPAQAGTLYLRTPISVLCDQTWSVGSGATLMLSGALQPGPYASMFDSSITKTGAGDLTLAGDVGTGALDVREGTLSLKGTTNAVALSTSLSTINVAARTRNVFNGKVKMNNAALAINMGLGSELVFAGGFEGEYHHPQRTGAAGADVYTTFTKPYVAGANTKMFIDSAPVWVTFAASGNTFADVFAYNGGHIVCAAPYAFNYVNGVIQLGHPFGGIGYLDLGGYDQGIVGHIYASDKSNDPTYASVVTSGVAAVLHLRKSNTTNPGMCLSFTGAAGFAKEGPNAASLWRPSPTTGTLSVSEGELELKAEATWLNCSAVNVTGGTLKINAVAFGKKVPISITGGKMQIPAGVVQRCATLTLGEKTYSAGTFGGRGSGAEYELEDYFVDGGGVLDVGRKGLILVVQ